MTSQSFEDFLTELGRNDALRGEAKALARDENGVPLSVLAEFAAKKGYEFTVEDVSVELAEEQLDAVAGGGGWQPLSFAAAGKVEGISFGLPMDKHQLFPKIEASEPFIKF